MAVGVCGRKGRRLARVSMLRVDVVCLDKRLTPRPYTEHTVSCRDRVALAKKVLREAWRI
jgi:hypothetical protein